MSKRNTSKSSTIYLLTDLKNEERSNYTSLLNVHVHGQIGQGLIGVLVIWRGHSCRVGLVTQPRPLRRLGAPLPPLLGRASSRLAHVHASAARRQQVRATRDVDAEDGVGRGGRVGERWVRAVERGEGEVGRGCRGGE